jgi:hypothetical protein
MPRPSSSPLAARVKAHLADNVSQAAGGGFRDSSNASQGWEAEWKRLLDADFKPHSAALNKDFAELLEKEFKPTFGAAEKARLRRQKLRPKFGLVVVSALAYLYTVLRTGDTGFGVEPIIGENQEVVEDVLRVAAQTASQLWGRIERKRLRTTRQKRIRIHAFSRRAHR